MIKISIRTCALEYLLGKQGSKGKDIIYSEIKMAEYLIPNELNLTISQKTRYFWSHNFSSKDKYDNCLKCEHTDDMLHIYN